MKKLFVVLMLTAFLLHPAFVRAEQKRNVFASWYNVSTQVTIALPVEVIADISIVNGDGTDEVCIGLYGGTIPADCVDTGDTFTPTMVMLGASSSLELYDFVTSSISLKAHGGGDAASPVTVVVTY